MTSADSAPTADPAIAQYVEYAAALIGLPLYPDHIPGVVDNMTRIQAVASLVMDFPLPDQVEAAPVFDPAPTYGLND